MGTECGWGFSADHSLSRPVTVHVQRPVTLPQGQRVLLAPEPGPRATPGAGQMGQC